MSASPMNDEPRPNTTRLFLALWPPRAVRDDLRAWRDAWTWPRRATPVPADKLHLTLHFLGALPEARLSALIDGVAVPFEPFRLDFGRPALWPHGIAVLEPCAAPPELLALHARLGAALVNLGLQPEARRYRPHVTLARRAGGGAMAPAGPPIAWQADSYALVESRAGAYTVVREYEHTH